jgi:hypothetical protein
MITVIAEANRLCWPTQSISMQGPGKAEAAFALGDLYLAHQLAPTEYFKELFAKLTRRLQRGVFHSLVGLQAPSTGYRGTERDGGKAIPLDSRPQPHHPARKPRAPKSSIQSTRSERCAPSPSAGRGGRHRRDGAPRFDRHPQPTSAPAMHMSAIHTQRNESG